MSARCCIFAVLIGADAAVSLRLAQPGLRAPRLTSPLRMMSADDFYFGESDVKVSASTTEAVEEEERELTEKEKEIARLRAAEVFMRKENGDASCTVCGYKYKMATGAGMTAPPSTPFDLLGDSWTCPQCKSPKAFFTPDTIEIAGFEDNQSYGFGTNTWTESQKSNAIFGGLFFFFLLLLSGYALN